MDNDQELPVLLQMPIRKKKIGNINYIALENTNSPPPPSTIEVQFWSDGIHPQ